jgi:hypothetical protein
MKGLGKQNRRWRQTKSALASATSFICALFVIAPLAFVVFYLIQAGASAFNWSFFTELPKPVGVAGGGMANAIVGTIELLGLAGLVGIPIGVLGGVYLAEFVSARGNSGLRFAADPWLRRRHGGRASVQSRYAENREPSRRIPAREFGVERAAILGAHVQTVISTERACHGDDDVFVEDDAARVPPATLHLHDRRRGLLDDRRDGV